MRCWIAASSGGENTVSLGCRFMSTSRTAGSAPAPTRRGHHQAPVAALSLACQLSSEGVAEPSTTLAPSMLAAVDRQVARRVARAFLLLVARVVLLVDHDQPQARQRGEHRHARAQHDARRAAGAPASQLLRRCGWVMPLCSAHHVVGAEALDEARLQLRREVDLGHQHQGLRLRLAASSVCTARR